MFVLLAASQILAAEPQQTQPVFSSNDFPSYLQKKGRSTGVLTRLTVDTAGNPVHCEAEIPSSDPKVDALSCDILLKRSRFAPARWDDGSAVMGVVRTSIIWALDKFLSVRPDIDLEVSALPRGIKSPLPASILLAVEPTGKITSCVGKRLPGSKDMQQPTNQLIALACAQAREGLAPIPAKDVAGTAQRSIQNAMVRFNVKKR